MAELNDKLITYGNLSTFYDKLQEQGLGGNAIEDVSVLPDASANKNKLVRLASDKKVYVSEYIEGTEGLGFAAMIVNDENEGNYYLYVRYSEGDNENGYAWAFNSHSEGFQNIDDYLEDSFGWNDVDTEDLIYTDTLTLSIGDVLDMGGTEVTVTDYSPNVGYEPATWGWKQLDYQPMQSITYAELKSLRDNSQLVPGQQYRITDYVTTTAQENTQSDGHQFDIIVVADSRDKLNKNARAIQHSGDMYFNNSKLEFWELKYCLDNDRNRFSWADTTNGKGVIYYMKDEWNNECPYDFKNIKFIDINLNDSFFTFDKNGDGSLVGAYYNNIIKPYIAAGVIPKLNANYFIISANNICHDNILEVDCYKNIFYGSCSNNTLYSSCFNNIINAGNFNTFGCACSDNTLGIGCNNNTFGYNCSYNTFGDKCSYNTFGDYCYRNTFGDYCHNNTFGDYCHDNNFTTNYNTSVSNQLQYINVLSGYSAGGAVPSGIVLNVNYSQTVGLNSQGQFTVKNPLD